ncbi:MAG TPA: serine protease [Stellaceae bacterium]|nr:serine protease [Stellaceae bacterium]
MNWLQRTAILFLLLIVLPQIVAKLWPDDFGDMNFDDGDGRRPVPAPEDAAPPSQNDEAPPDRVRRPLPEAAPNDPLISVDTESLKPDEYAFGTAFPIAPDNWLTARHVANGDCQRVVLIVDGKKVPATIAYLHPQADLALLKTKNVSGPVLPLETGTIAQDATGYTFGYPNEKLGATQDRLMGRSRMQLSGEIQGTGPVLAWAELARYPDSLPALSGMSGGPVFDTHGRIIGIMVATSVRRGRIYTVAPEILQATEQAYALSDASTQAEPVSDVTTSNVSLSDTARALYQSSRMVPTFCVPAGS